MKTSIIRRHLPLITPRVEFSFVDYSSQLQAPNITPRMDFQTLCLQSDGNSTINLHAETDEGQAAGNIFEGQDAGESEDSETSDSGRDDAKTEAVMRKHTKIPKPCGEPGRPGSGGYNIESVLIGWTAELILEVKNYVKNNTGIMLDETKRYGKQKPPAKQRFPIIDKYENHWPIRDMLKLHLKAASRAYRKHA
ncbi:hypothetical protein CVT26_008104 [Gymnopilus dilepis]|uniref:Uncharacterized protein n=1 Tax=Gymnopilus dilepis TaxID=231916 RepID=A0A409WWE7_9AGAR|nr:hypothetical protein CVT26_008104 [Gymnopilus dilepis]